MQTASQHAVAANEQSEECRLVLRPRIPKKAPLACLALESEKAHELCCWRQHGNLAPALFDSTRLDLTTTATLTRSHDSAGTPVGTDEPTLLV